MKAYLKNLSPRNALFERATIVRDIVLSANDGIVTTFAIIAGAQGANLPNSIVIILGFANLFADAISMSSGNYMGTESENNVLNSKNIVSKIKIKNTVFRLSPVRSAVITFVAFTFAGIIPLLPYLTEATADTKFFTSVFLVFLTLLGLAVLRAHYTNKNKWATVFETLVVGTCAASIAYFVGFISEPLIATGSLESLTHNY